MALFGASLECTTGLLCSRRPTDILSAVTSRQPLTLEAPVRCVSDEFCLRWGPEISVSENQTMVTVRSFRFSIATPIKYRAVREKTWREGTTINISKTGILFQAGEPCAPGTRIEMKFSLPLQSNPETTTSIRCRGVVLRCDGTSIIAARMSGPRIERRP
jgi:hypothetical protein